MSDPLSQPAFTSHDPYAALRFRNFWVFAGGWVINVVADQMTEVAVGWDVYQRTHDAMSLAWVGLVSAAPVILLALFAGHIADRFDRRRIIFVTQWVRSLALIGLAVVAFQRGAIGWMYMLLAVIATTRAVGWPARSAMLPTLIPREVFPNAVAWNSSFFQVAAMVGPALGGLVVNWSVSWAYLIAAVFSGIFASTTLTLVYHSPVERRREPMTLHSLAAGVRFVSHTKIILATMSLDLFAVLLGGATYLLPIFATVYLHVGSVGFGWLRAAPAIGALLMGLVVAHLPMKHAGRSMLWAVVVFGVATIAFGLSRNFWLSCFMLFLTGAADNVSVMVRHTLVQLLTPDEMRGRVSAVNNVFIGASNEIGGFESGLTAKIFGPIVSVVGGGIGTIIVVALAAIIWPDLRKFGSLHEAREETPRQPQGFEVIPLTAPPSEGETT